MGVGDAGRCPGEWGCCSWDALKLRVGATTELDGGEKAQDWRDPTGICGGGSLKECVSGSARARKTGGSQREWCLGRSGGASSGVTLSQMGRGLTPGPGSHACWM